MRVAKTGNEIIAEAMRQIAPDVVAAYPITPSTEMVQVFSEFVAAGLVDTEFVTAESEHSALTMCIGAAVCGARTMTATSAQGLAMLWEMLYIASGMRLPIVLCVANRTLSAPINIHCDHSDSMGARDSGWIQLYSENAQEAYDNTILAVRIAEKTLLPVMNCIDGFIISHGMEVVDILEDEQVKNFIGEYIPRYSFLDTSKPITYGAIDFTDYFFEHKRAQIEAMNTAQQIIKEIEEEYYNRFNRRYGPVEAYMLEDAQMAIVVMGSTAGNVKVVIDQLREENKENRIGLLKIRTYRPFPTEQIIKALSNVEVVAIMDRADSLNAIGGPLLADISTVLYPLNKRPKLVNYIYGLGGRDVPLSLIRTVFNDLLDIKEGRKAAFGVKYLGVRE